MGKHRPHFLVIPFSSQGHLLPLLDLVGVLAAEGVLVTVVVTPRNLPLLSSLLSSFPAVIPLVLPFPVNKTFLPAGAENTKDLPPTHFTTLMHAMGALHEPLLDWAKSLMASATPLTALISDIFCGWTQNLAKELNIPRLVFSPSGAFAMAVMNSLWRDMPDESPEISFPCLPNCPSFPWNHLSTIYRGYVKGDPIYEFIKDGFSANMESWGWIFNTFNELECEYLEYMKCDLGHDRVWAVGPLNAAHHPDKDRGGQNSVDADEVRKWLDARDDGSVVYVCFGSQAVLSKKQAEALATAMVHSGVQFIWALRGCGNEEIISAEYVKLVADRGLVINGWAPQLMILNHPAVGAFVTHCGWNSALEAITAGTAMLMWPMGADQFTNAKLLEDDVGIGVRVCEGKDGVPEVKAFAKKVAAALEKTAAVTAKAIEVKEMAVNAVKDGGSSMKDMRALVDVLSLA